MKYIVWIFIAITAIIGFGYIKGDDVITNVVTAVEGHIVDAKDRILTEDSYINGMSYKRGFFDTEAEGQDAVHWAQGSASIITTAEGHYIQLGHDFNSGPLPDGYVYISYTGDIKNEADFLGSEQIELGKLLKGNGASYYKIPNDVRISQIKSITIWCKAFSEYIGSANV